MHKIYFWPAGPRWGTGGAYTTLPRTPNRMVRGHLSPRFLPPDAFGVSISRHTEWGIWPRDNVFPGPAVALDGPGGRTFKTEPSGQMQKL